MIPTKVLRDVGFQKNVQEKFKIMGQDRGFSDVTLTSEDGTRFQAHKVALAATSTFFREYFHRQKGDNFVCMGINSIFLASMLDMVYFGEARIEKVNCSSFLRFLQDCKVLESKMCKESNDKSKVSKLCNFWNRGFCRVGSSCLYDHPEDDCFDHLNHGLCSNQRCTLRHRQACKHWESGWCRRENDCAFLHRQRTQSRRSRNSSSSGSRVSDRSSRSNSSSRSRSSSEEYDS